MICICGESSDLTCLYGEGVYGGLHLVLQDCVDHAMTLNQLLPCNTAAQCRQTQSQTDSHSQSVSQSVTESVSMIHSMREGGRTVLTMR